MSISLGFVRVPLVQCVLQAALELEDFVVQLGDFLFQIQCPLTQDLWGLSNCVISLFFGHSCVLRGSQSDLRLADIIVEAVVQGELSRSLWVWARAVAVVVVLLSVIGMIVATILEARIRADISRHEILVLFQTGDCDWLGLRDDWCSRPTASHALKWILGGLKVLIIQVSLWTSFGKNLTTVVHVADLLLVDDTLIIDKIITHLVVALMHLVDWLPRNFLDAWRLVDRLVLFVFSVFGRLRYLWGFYAAVVAFLLDLGLQFIEVVSWKALVRVLQIASLYGLIDSRWADRCLVLWDDHCAALLIELSLMLAQRSVCMLVEQRMTLIVDSSKQLLLALTLVLQVHRIAVLALTSA